MFKKTQKKTTLDAKKINERFFFGAVMLEKRTVNVAVLTSTQIAYHLS